MLDKALLKDFDVFSDVPDAKLEEIAQISDIVEFKAQDVIFKENDTAKNLYGVLDGEVELSLIFEDRVLKTNIQYEESILARMEYHEKPIVVETLGPGEAFGWSSLVNPRQLTATARCPVASKIIFVPATELKAMFGRDASLGYLIMQKLAEIISQRLQHRTEKLIESWGEAFGLSNI